MSNSYNLTTKGEAVRIGNWFEEVQLKESTGIRFYPSPKDRKLALLTQERCISHTDQMLPKDYSSTTRDTIVRPDIHPDYGKQSNILGPRQKRFEEQLKAQIEEEIKKKESENFTETRKVDYESTTQAGYLHPPFKPSVNDKDSSSYIPTKNSNYSTDVPVTYYSHVINSEGMKANFPTTFVGATNPYKKNCAFTAVPDSAVFSRRAETNERPRPLPSLREHRALNTFRDRLMHAAKLIVDAARTFQVSYPDGQCIRHIIETIWSASTMSDTVDIERFQQVLSDAYGSFIIAENERTAMLASYDMHSNGQLSLIELTHLIRRTPAPRRLELIDVFFGAMSSPETGSIEFSTIEARIAECGDNECIDSLLRALNITSGGSIGADDFFDYYIDLSNEVGDNNTKFEDIMLRTWGKV